MAFIEDLVDQLFDLIFSALELLFYLAISVGILWTLVALAGVFVKWI